MRKKAFTLVELLVVIAIISILAAMLLPTLEQALEGARTTACMSNQKQLALAMQMYVDDHDQRLPDKGIYAGYSYIRDWVAEDYIGAYVPKDAPVSDGSGGYIFDMKSAFYCPSDKESGDLVPPINGYLWNSSYAMCYHQFMSRALVRFSQLKRPDHKLMFIQQIPLYPGHYYASVCYWESSYSRCSFFHMGDTNTTFMDGHTSRIADSGDWRYISGCPKERDEMTGAVFFYKVPSSYISNSACCD